MAMIKAFIAQQNANGDQVASGHANDIAVSFLLQVDALVDASVGRHKGSDLSHLMRSRSISSQNQSKRLNTMRLLLDAGSVLSCSYSNVVKSWMESPYDLQEALAIYDAYARRSDALTLKQFMRRNTLLKPFRNALYTFLGPLEVQLWTSQIANVALRFNLNFGADLKTGVLYFDGPFKYSIWFEECCSKEPLSSLVPQLKDHWFDQIISERKFDYFKAWFDTLIWYDATQQEDTRPNIGTYLDRYLEPTLHAFIGGHIAPWFSALRDAGVDVHAVVSRTFELASGEKAPSIVDHIKKEVSRTMRPFPRKYLLPSYCQHILTTEDLKRTMAAVFRDCGHDPNSKDGFLNEMVRVSLDLLGLILAALAAFV